MQLININIKQKKVYVMDTFIPFQPMEFVYYLYFAERTVAGLGSQILTDQNNLEFFVERIIEYHKNIFPNGESQRSTLISDLNKLKGGRDIKIFLGNYRSIISKCNKEIRETLRNISLNEDFEINVGGSRGGKTYGLNVSPDKIKIPSPKVYPTFKNKVKYYKPDESLSKALAEMKRNNFSQVVLIVQNQLKLITTDGLATWLIKMMNSKSFALKKTIINDILEYERDDNVYFFGRNRPIVEARKEFSETLSKNRPKLYAIIITETGESTEEPLGIITPWDFLDPKYW